MKTVELGGRIEIEWKLRSIISAVKTRSSPEGKIEATAFSLEFCVV